mmetsp:Transcript_41779/g.103003  ORF Transcript_41779/g.103003 Transcript_41779/m.103003 type:complete len:757 (+) Transcript_41779:50-2320(+)
MAASAAFSTRPFYVRNPGPRATVGVRNVRAPVSPLGPIPNLVQCEVGFLSLLREDLGWSVQYCAEDQSLNEQKKKGDLMTDIEAAFEVPADAYAIFLLGRGAEDGSLMCHVGGDVISYSDIVDAFESRTTHSGHEILFIFVDADHSGAWCAEAEETSATNVFVQASCGANEKAQAAAVFLHGWTNFQSGKLPEETFLGALGGLGQHPCYYRPKCGAPIGGCGRKLSLVGEEIGRAVGQKAVQKVKQELATLVHEAQNGVTQPRLCEYAKCRDPTLPRLMEDGGDPRAGEAVGVLQSFLVNQEVSSGALKILWTLARHGEQRRDEILAAGGVMLALKAMDYHSTKHPGKTPVVVSMAFGLFCRLTVGRSTCDELKATNAVPLLRNSARLYADDADLQRLACVVLARVAGAGRDHTTQDSVEFVLEVLDHFVGKSEECVAEAVGALGTLMREPPPFATYKAEPAADVIETVGEDFETGTVVRFNGAASASLEGHVFYVKRTMLNRFLLWWDQELTNRVEGILITSGHFHDARNAGLKAAYCMEPSSDVMQTSGEDFPTGTPVCFVGVGSAKVQDGCSFYCRRLGMNRFELYLDKELSMKMNGLSISQGAFTPMASIEQGPELDPPVLVGGALRNIGLALRQYSTSLAITRQSCIAVTRICGARPNRHVLATFEPDDKTARNIIHGLVKAFAHFQSQDLEVCFQILTTFAVLVHQPELKDHIYECGGQAVVTRVVSEREVELPHYLLDAIKSLVQKLRN